MAHLFTTNPKFTTRYLLTTRSPWNFTHKCVDIALRFAVLGRIDEAVEILECADSYVPIAARYIHDPGLYFAFQAADWWPDFTPDEDMEDEDLLRGLEVNTVSIRFGMLLLDHARDVESLQRDGRDLKRVIVYLREPWDSDGDGKKEDFVFVEPEVGGDEPDSKTGVSMSIDSAVLFGLHLALKLEDDEAMDILVSIIRSNIELYLRRLARYRFVWRVLAKGILAPDDEEGKAAITAEFERIKDTIKRRLRNGVQHPFLDHSMRDLVKMLDENTLRNEQGEDFDEWNAPLRTIIDDKPSIRNPGATQKTIDVLEERLDVELPDDYKEFLRFSDGMEGIWNGYYPQRFLAPSARVKNSENWTANSPLLFSLISYTELPDNFDPPWPSLDLKSCVVINIENGEFLWLVSGECMREARELLVSEWEEMAEGKGRKWVERVVGDFFGGMEELVEGREEEEWGVVYWDRAGLPVEVWGSFREWIEGAVVESEFPDVLMERKDDKI